MIHPIQCQSNHVDIKTGVSAPCVQPATEVDYRGFSQCVTHIQVQNAYGKWIKEGRYSALFGFASWSTF